MAGYPDILEDLSNVTGMPATGYAPIYDGTNFALTQTYSKAQVDTLLTSYATTSALDDKANLASGNAYTGGGSQTFADGDGVAAFTLNADTHTLAGFNYPGGTQTITLAANTGTVTATTFSGSGASLTNIPNSATTATSAATNSAIVARDSSGGFSAGNIRGTRYQSTNGNFDWQDSSNALAVFTVRSQFLRHTSGINLADDSFNNTTTALTMGGTRSHSSGTATIVQVAPTDSTTGTAAITAFKVNLQGTGTGSGAKLLMQLQDVGTDRVTVTRAGAFTAVSLNLGGATVTDILSATATLDFAATDPSDPTITVTGAAVGDTVCIGPQHASVGANNVFYGWVSAADTVTIRKTGSADPASGTFRATVIKI